MSRDQPARNAATGAFVGVLDTAFVYPLAVLATRRENGMTLRASIAAGRLYAGGLTAATLIIPYSACVEGLSNYVKACTSTSRGKPSVQEDTAAAIATAVVVTLFGMQPIEKKLVMDQMLQREVTAAASKKPSLLQVPQLNSSPALLLSHCLTEGVDGARQGHCGLCSNQRVACLVCWDTASDRPRVSLHHSCDRRLSHRHPKGAGVQHRRLN